TKPQEPLYQKPFIIKFAGAQIGGYLDFRYVYEREEGIVEEATFQAKQFNIFAYSRLFNRATIFTEIEFEEGTEEIKIEIAQFDFNLSDKLNFRAGILLPPLGRFNVNHDSPKNNFTFRPLVSTELIPSTLSELGAGIFGLFSFKGDFRINYTLYLTNGFNDGIILNSGEGTRFSAGKPSLAEDNNTVPSITGRVGIAPFNRLEIGASFHTGIYNKYSAEGILIDEKRKATILAADWDFSRDFKFGTFGLTGEYAYAKIDIPESLIGTYAERQSGYYFELKYDFLRGLIKILPKSFFTAAIRYNYVDFDSDIEGDFIRQLAVGLNFRPFEDTVLKFNYTKGWTYDRINNLTRAVFLTSSIATYF
ncbi:MAG: hypothetical protein ACRDFC_01550, partial [Ignavibacteria bacterium]